MTKQASAQSKYAGVLAINGGTSSIKFALYQMGKPLKKNIDGSIDRIGLPGTKLTFNDSTGNQKGSLILKSSDTRSGSNFLIGWPEEKIDFSVIGGVGHRVVFGMKHTEPERITQELMSELRRISPYDTDHLPAEIDLIEALRQRHKSYALCLKEGSRRGHAAQNCTAADFGDKVLPRMRYAPGNHVVNAVSPAGGA